MVAHGNKVPQIDELTILFHRKLAARLLEWACGYPESSSVSENHPRYQVVTEGRDVGAMQDKYSSCGDLPHWLLWRLGVRLPWVNRAEGPGDWRIGQNTILLQAEGKFPKGYYGACPVAQVWRGQSLDAGDTLLISRTDHSGVHAVCVVAAHDALLNTAQYGQPGGALVDCRITTGERLCTVCEDGSLSHGRIIRCVLRLPDVLRAALQRRQLVACQAPPPAIDLSEQPTQPGTPGAKLLR